jgi:hypothetical protein
MFFLVSLDFSLQVGRFRGMQSQSGKEKMPWTITSRRIDIVKVNEHLLSEIPDWRDGDFELHRRSMARPLSKVDCKPISRI